MLKPKFLQSETCFTRIVEASFSIQVRTNGILSTNSLSVDGVFIFVIFLSFSNFFDHFQPLKLKSSPYFQWWLIMEASSFSEDETTKEVFLQLPNSILKLGVYLETWGLQERAMASFTMVTLFWSLVVKEEILNKVLYNRDNS